MTKALRRILPAVAMGLVLAACGAVGGAAPQPQPTAEAMADKPTAEAMADKPTADTMMGTTADTMMDTTAEAMMDTTADTMMDTTAEAMADKPTADTMMDTTAEAMADKPAGEAIEHAPATLAQAPWLALPLTDVRTGQSFTLADFAGRPVFVETMATWCANCRAQLTSVQEAIGALEGQPPVFVALSVETTLPPEQLAGYAADNGFAPIFAVASPELLQALVETFGRTITNPPSTPHFIIAPDGGHGELVTGFSPAEQIIALLAAAGEGA